MNANSSKMAVARFGSALLGGCLLLPPALATPSGFYMMAGVTELSTGLQQLQSQLQSPGRAGAEHDDTHPFVGLGYQFSPHFALEFGSTQFLDASDTILDPQGTSRRVTLDIDGEQTHALAVISLPLSDSLSLDLAGGKSEFNVKGRFSTNEVSVRSPVQSSEQDVRGFGLTYSSGGRLGFSARYLEYPDLQVRGEDDVSQTTVGLRVNF